MAIPKTLRPIDKSKAERLITKNLEAGTGEWEYSPGVGDFIYKVPSGRYMMIRKGWGDSYEGGQVSM